jgi:hypothetical protein
LTLIRNLCFMDLARLSLLILYTYPTVPAGRWQARCIRSRFRISCIKNQESNRISNLAIGFYRNQPLFGRPVFARPISHNITVLSSMQLCRPAYYWIFLPVYSLVSGSLVEVRVVEAGRSVCLVGRLNRLVASLLLSASRLSTTIISYLSHKLLCVISLISFLHLR